MPDNTNTATAGTSTVTVRIGNEIGKKAILGAGVTFVFFTSLAILALIAYWPDRLPNAGATTAAIYRNDLFNICLIDSANKCDTCTKVQATQPSAAEKAAWVNKLLGPAGAQDSLTKARRTADSLRFGAIYDGIHPVKPLPEECCNNTIALNTLMMILIALAGFMGSMIHIGSSFSNFIGSEQFKKSWLLWYVLKPFTGAGLAIIFYFVFRAGLLTFNDASNINLYGMITLAAMTGLFTDKATLKLEEIFAAMFAPKDTRPDKLTKDAVNVKITGITPATLFTNADNEYVISGESLDKKKFVIKINEEEIKEPVIKADSISFKFKLLDPSSASEFVLRLFDETGAEVFKSPLTKGEKPTEAASAEQMNQDEFGDADADDEMNKPNE